MMKILQIIIIITFNVYALFPGIVADKADFVFLERRRQNIKPTKNFQNSKEFDEFDYYISNNEASWTVAIDECVLTFPNGHLVSLETQAEWKYIKREIDDYGGNNVDPGWHGKTRGSCIQFHGVYRNPPGSPNDFKGCAINIKCGASGRQFCQRIIP